LVQYRRATFEGVGGLDGIFISEEPIRGLGAGQLTIDWAYLRFLSRKYKNLASSMANI